MKKKQYFILGLTAVTGCCVLTVLAYFLPPVQSRVDYRVEELRVLVKSYLNPPEKIDFSQQEQVAAIAQATVYALTPSITPTLAPTLTATLPENTPEPTQTPTATPTPLPGAFRLTGVVYTSQHGRWNYCAPANLTMALSFWGRKDGLTTVGTFLKPYEKDKNVMPYEMANYVEQKTDLAIAVRTAGSAELLKRLLVNGFPVLVEKGAYIKDISGVVSWMGHYEVVTGYDDARQVYITQDSYYTPDFEVDYSTFLQGWRSFNYQFLIVYPKDRDAQIRSLLGPQQVDEKTSWNTALEIATREASSLTGVDQFFAIYNRGSALAALEDYPAAAEAFDRAFTLYATFPEDKSIRPYRILWYQTGPYYAYFFTKRYQDVISKANATIASVLDEPALEESYVWRARAEEALGNKGAAVKDLQEALHYHPGFQPALDELARINQAP